MFIEKLQNLSESSYGDFTSKLIPTIDRTTILGVRVPKMRALAKSYQGTPAMETFLHSLPHTYYDENVLHALFVSGEKDVETAFARLATFLPYIDNWAVCDILSPKVFKKHRSRLLPFCQQWMASSHVYTIRFGVCMLMTHFLEEDYDPKYLAWPAEINEEDYYVKMMVAWFYATALAKQWDDTIVYLEERRLSPWIHNKTIQKGVESLRITEEQKAYLKSLRLKK